jgi:hypothetical protein
MKHFLGEEKTTACLKLIMRVFPRLHGLEFALSTADLAALLSPQPRSSIAIDQAMRTVAQMVQLRVLSFTVENTDPEPLAPIGKLVHLTDLSLNAPTTDHVLGMISRGCLCLRSLDLYVRQTAGEHGMHYIAQGSSLITCLKLSGFKTSSDIALAAIIRHSPDIHKLDCDDLAVGIITLGALMLSPCLQVVSLWA